MVLLDLLARLRDECVCTLHVAHFHHGVRGADADADAAFVQARAEALDVPFHLGRPDGPLSPGEAGLRAARYAWLAHAAHECGAAHVAVGHTRDDQVETLLLRLTRGTGLHGLGGMRPIRQLASGVDVQRVRPMLDVTRADILTYARDHGVAYREDATNAELRYRRNQVRHRVVPALRALAPDVEQRMARLADRLAADEAYLADTAATLAHTLEVGRGMGWCTYDRAALAAAPTPLLTRVLRGAFQAVAATPYAPDADAVETVVAALRESGHDGALDWTQGVRVRWAGDRVTVALVPDPADLAPQQLSVPGAITWRPTGQRFTTRVCTAATAPATANGVGALRAARASAPQTLVVRGWQPGDTWRPAGHTGTESVGETLRQLGVPLDRRPAAPVVAGEQGVWWVVGARPPADAGAVGATGQMLEVAVG